MRISDLRYSFGEARWVTAKIGQHDLNAQYLPSGISPRFMRRLEEAGESAAWVPDALAQVLVGWDLLNDDGSPYVIARENLEELPTLVLYAVLTAICEDYAGPYQKER